MGWLDATEEDILLANYEKYNDDNIIKFYKDFRETKYAYTEYEVIFSAVVQLLQHELGNHIRTVDMCGGAGKAAFVLRKCAPEAEVTLVDLSDKMLDIARQRMKEDEVGTIEIIQEDVMSFLGKDRQFDLIVFSSAIHHFKDPVELLKSASERLSDHGVIVTIADPTTLTKSTRYKFLEFMISKPADKVKKIKQIIRFNKKGSLDVLAATLEEYDIAEYQTITGIDDIMLRTDLAANNLQPLMHMRYPAGDPFMIKMLTFINLPWAFSMVLSQGLKKDHQHITRDLCERIEKDMPFKVTYL